MSEHVWPDRLRADRRTIEAGGHHLGRWLYIAGRPDRVARCQDCGAWTTAYPDRTEWPPAQCPVNVSP